MNLKTFLRQHNDIIEIVDEIEKLLSQKDYLINNAAQVSYKIASLSGKLSLHMKSEDNYLYPKIKNENKTLAEEFIHDLTPITQAFNDYKKKYMIASNIKSNPSEFVEETKQIIDALRKRIKIEEEKLYPVLPNDN